MRRRDVISTHSCRSGLRLLTRSHGEGVLDGRAGLAPYALCSSNEVSVPVQIQPCPACDEWHLEVRPEPTGPVQLVEWHRADCTHLEALLADDISSRD